MNLWIMYRHASVTDATVTTWTGSYQNALHRFQNEGGRQAELFHGTSTDGDTRMVASIVDGEFHIHGGKR